MVLEKLMAYTSWAGRYVVGSLTMIGIDWQLAYIYVKWSALENAIDVLEIRIESLSSRKLDIQESVRHVVTNVFSHVQNKNEHGT